MDVDRIAAILLNKNSATTQVSNVIDHSDSISRLTGHAFNDADQCSGLIIHEWYLESNIF